MRSCNACEPANAGPVYAMQFQSPTAANSTKGQPVETFAAQFTRHGNLKPLPMTDEEMVGPSTRGVVKYELKCIRDPQTAAVTGKWRVYLPQLGITLNLRTQGAIEGRRLKFVGVHV